MNKLFNVRNHRLLKGGVLINESFVKLYDKSIEVQELAVLVDVQGKQLPQFNMDLRVKNNFL